jgi:hypothetical protein
MPLVLCCLDQISTFEILITGGFAHMTPKEMEKEASELMKKGFH